MLMLVSDSWIPILGDKEIWISPEKMNFLEAQEYCASRDSTLIEPRFELVFNDAIERASDLYLASSWIGVVDTEEEGR